MFAVSLFRCFVISLFRCFVVSLFVVLPCDDEGGTERLPPAKPSPAAVSASGTQHGRIFMPAVPGERWNLVNSYGAAPAELKSALHADLKVGAFCFCGIYGLSSNMMALITSACDLKAHYCGSRKLPEDRMECGDQGS